MPKRKAHGPVESSDGEEDDYYGFQGAPIQSPFPKQVPNNFHRPPSPKKNSSSVGVPPMFNFGSSNPPQTPKFDPLPSEQQQSKAPLLFGIGNQSSLSVPKIGVSKKPRNQEFSKSLKDLNSAFISSCKAVFSRNPSHSLIPVVKDYLHHSRVLMEQHRKGGDSEELVNGINSSLKSFKTLGEFFDEFERMYVEPKQDNHEERTPRTTGASTNFGTSSTLPSASDKSKGFSLNESPSNNNGAGSLGPSFSPPSSGSSFKLNTTSTSPLKTALEAGKAITATTANSFFSSFTETTSRPQLTTALASSTTTTLSTTSTLKDTTPEATNLPKPAAKAAFTGFSFFPPHPPISTSNSLNTNPGTTATKTDAEEKNDEENNDEEDEPPKVEVTQVKEDDSVYSIRCKVFCIVDAKCLDRGVGMLYVKKLEDGRYQTVVRADNNLGTVILNILLQKSLPLEKKSKNTIMTVDLQANNKKGLPVILKVKSEEDATELLGKLKQFQQSS